MTLDALQANGNGYTEFNSNGVVNATEHTNEIHSDGAFQSISKSQQSVLLLHGPGQKYSLD